MAIMNTQLSKLKNLENEGEMAELLVWYVAIDESHQNKGIGTELYKMAYEAALNEVKMIKLSSGPSWARPIRRRRFP